MLSLTKIFFIVFINRKNTGANVLLVISLISVIRVQQTKLTQKDLDKMYNDLVNDIEKLFAEIKKLVEQEKVAEEQERLKRLQVGDRIYECSYPGNGC